MRIISGKFKGRKLSSFNADNIRPTSDRVKESLFNIIHGTCEGAKVLDLFAGTGNVSFEFLSRGAASVTAVENNNASVNIIKKNISLLGAEGINIVKKDVMVFLSNEALDYDYIFVDPPFTEKIGEKVMIHLSDCEIINDDIVIIIETSKFEPFQLDYPPFQCYDQRKFGDKNLSFFKVLK